MNRDEKIVDFPKAEITPEERARRLKVEVERLARQSPTEWMFWLPDSANQHVVSPATLEAMIKATVKENEKKALEAKAEDRQREQRVEKERMTAQRAQERERKREQDRISKEAERKQKEKQKAFANLIKLPSAQHEAKLVKLATWLGEDIAVLRAEFSDLVAESSAVPAMESWHVEPWPELVATPALLQALVDKINKHFVMRPHEVLAVALWVMLAWVHEVAAHHSPYLVAISADADCGKTTLIIEVVGRLTPKPYRVGEPTAAIYRLIDHEKPTLLVDDADTLFQRKPDLRQIFNLAWTRGTKIPRHERLQGRWVTVQFDPFCPKACTLIESHKLPRPLMSRCCLNQDMAEEAPRAG